MVKEGKENCFQVLRDSHGQADHETAINIQVLILANFICICPRFLSFVIS